MDIPYLIILGCMLFLGVGLAIYSEDLPQGVASVLVSLVSVVLIVNEVF